MPIQKVTQDEFADFAVNFFREPKQCKAQLKTIVQLVTAHVSSRKTYLQTIGADHDIIMEPEGQKPEDELPAELAKIIVGVFGQFTSVVFDIDSIIEQFQSEVEESRKAKSNKDDESQ